MVLIPTRIPSGKNDNEYYTGYITAPPSYNNNNNHTSTPTPGGYNNNTPTGNGGNHMNGSMNKPSTERRKTDGYGLPIAKSPWQADFHDGIPHIPKGAFREDDEISKKNFTDHGDDDTMYKEYGYVKYDGLLLKKGRDIDENGNRVKRQGSTDDKMYISDNNSGKFWDARATEQVLNDKRSLFKKMLSPPPIDQGLGEPDPLADPRAYHECCFIQLPKLPPHFYDVSAIPYPQRQTPIRDIIPLTKESMWAEQKDDTVLDQFPPLIAKPTIPVIIFASLIIVSWALLEFPPIQPLLEKQFPKATQTYIAELASIPVVSILFTYFHIWLALWLLFHPIEFFGVGRIPGTNVGQPGWQGIIPFKAEIMARISVRNMATNLIDPRYMFKQVDARRVAEEIGPIIRDTAKTIVTAVGTQNPDYKYWWDMLPQRTKDEVIENVAEDTPDIIQDMFYQMSERFDDVFSIEDMAVKWLTDHPRYLVNMFVQCGWRELCLIRNNGAVMGFVFGIIQLVLWIFYDKWWYVPIYNIIVGSITNTIALLLIFRPINPIKLGPLTLHGLFYKDQPKLSVIYSKMIADKILTVQHITDTITTGPQADAHLIEERMGVALKNALKQAMGLERYVLPTHILNEIHLSMTNQMVAAMPRVLQAAGPYMHKAMRAEEIIRDNVANLSYKDFDNLLHPVFKQDEWKLVGTGGFLGLIVGLIQIIILKPEVLGAYPDYCSKEGVHCDAAAI